MSLSPYSRAHLGRFLCDIKRVGGFGLHAECHLKRFDARFKLVFLMQLFCMHRIELVREIKLPPLVVRINKVVVNVQENLIQRHLRRIVNIHALVEARQERRLAIFSLPAKRNEPRHILVFSAQPVYHPRTH